MLPLGLQYLLIIDDCLNEIDNIQRDVYVDMIKKREGKDEQR